MVLRVNHIFKHLNSQTITQIALPSLVTSEPLPPRNGKRYFSCGAAMRKRYVQFAKHKGGRMKLGVQLGDTDSDIIEISSLDAGTPNTLLDFLNLTSDRRKVVNRVVAEAKSVVNPKNVYFYPPITNPDKVICVGLNYKGHCDEQNKPYPQEPFFFSKFPSTIVGPNDEVIHPPNSKALDWEVELAVIIGKTARCVLKNDAMDYVFGFTVAQDISARDWQKHKNNGQWLIAKSMDTFCPLGPGIVTKESLRDVYNLQLKCAINGVEKQNGFTNDFVHNIDDVVAFLSHCFTLLPGDVILTGTPSGVGVFRNPREFLQPGDVLESEISEIGKLSNKIVAFSKN
ncbi:oxaloacetate tautomerase FAHD2A, mitochondrial [Bemisia tabaci]|uniref:oxaloacetate tautomerase FAHD2A, mitochondrial n=1 Tax=Bemisia tabaci TaxID=7038 RepID=UPI003B28BD50